MNCFFSQCLHLTVGTSIAIVQLISERWTWVSRHQTLGVSPVSLPVLGQSWALGDEMRHLLQMLQHIRIPLKGIFGRLYSRWTKCCCLFSLRTFIVLNCCLCVGWCCPRGPRIQLVALRALGRDGVCPLMNPAGLGIFCSPLVLTQRRAEGAAQKDWGCVQSHGSPGLGRKQPWKCCLLQR